MKKQIIAFLSCICLIVTSVPIHAMAGVTEGQGTVGISDVSDKSETKKPTYVTSFRDETSYYALDGSVSMHYVEPPKEFGTESEGSSYAMQQAAVTYSSNRDSQFFNDCANNYGFLSFDSEQNSSGYQTLYIRIRELLLSLYQSTEDYELESMGNFSFHYAGSVSYEGLGLSNEDLMTIYLCVLLDHPLVYFMDDMILYDGFQLYLGVSEEFALGETRARLQTSIKEMIEEKAELTKEQNTTYEIVKVLHDEIIRTASYAYEANGVTPQNNGYVHSIAGYVHDGNKIVCDGYSETLATILNYLDIHNMIAVGWGVKDGEFTSDASAHAWNVVQFGDGMYYFVDVTWDDMGEYGISMEYFGKGTSFYNTHTLNKSSDDTSTGVQFMYPLTGISDTDATSTSGLVTVKDPVYTLEREVDFTFRNGVLTFSGNGEVVQPEEYVDGAWCQYRDKTKKIVFEEGITHIGNFTFMDFDKLEEIVFADSVSGLGQQAFDGCDALVEVVLPDNLTYFDSEVFARCASLEKVTFGSMSEGGALIRAAVNPFRGSDALAEIVVPEENWAYKVTDGVLMTKDGKSLIAYPAKKMDTSYVVPSSVIIIEFSAFCNANSLKDISITEGVKYIAASSFENCMGLTKLVIPSSYLENDTDPKTTEDAIVNFCANLEYIENRSENPVYLQSLVGGGDPNDEDKIYGYWYSKGTGMCVTTVTKGAAYLKWFGQILYLDEEFEVDNIRYRMTSYAFSDELNFSPTVDQMNESEFLGTATVVLVSGKTIPSEVTYRGWKYKVKVPSGQPSAPANVKAVLYGHDDVKVSWSKVSGVKTYAVRYCISGSTEYTFAGYSNGTYLEIPNLSDGKKYIFEVHSCYGSMATLGIYSNSASVYTLKKLSKPTVSKYSSSKVTIKFENISGETGYQISCSTSKTGTNIIKTTSSASYTVSTTKNKTYYYKVRAYKSVGSAKIYGPWSDVRSYNLRNVSALTDLTANLYGHDDVKLTWDAAKGANCYYVYYKTSSDSSYKYKGKTTKTSYKFSGLSDGKKYYFQVVPVYRDSDGEVLAKGTADTVSRYTLKKITGVKVAKKSSTKVKVSWSNISGESGYQVSCSTSKSKTKIVSTYKTTSGKSKTLSVKKGKTYYYKVRSYSTVKGVKIYGPWSDVISYKVK